MDLLFAKVALAPLMILAATLIARRLGPRAGGFFIRLPTTALPFTLTMYLMLGVDAAVVTATGAITGQLTCALFCIAYARSGPRLGAFRSTLAALAVGPSGAHGHGLRDRRDRFIPATPAGHRPGGRGGIPPHDPGGHVPGRSSHGRPGHRRRDDAGNVDLHSSHGDLPGEFRTPGAAPRDVVGPGGEPGGDSAHEHRGVPRGSSTLRDAAATTTRPTPPNGP